MVVRGAIAGSLNGMRVGQISRLACMGELGDLSAFLVVLCAGIMHGILLLLLAPQKWWLGFVLFLHLVVHNLSQLYTCAIIFSPLYFLHILLLEEMFIPVQRL